MLIRDVLDKKGTGVVTIGGERTIHDAVGLLNQHGIGALVVTGAGGDIEGILTERDILRLCGEFRLFLAGSPGSDSETVPPFVRDVMTRDVVVGVPEDRVDYVMNVMTAKRIRHLPIVQDGKLAGMISIGDVVNAQVVEAEFEARMLRDYVQGRTY
jgi:CBS domain-containing protein